MILHFCSRGEWDEAVRDGAYAADTLATEGFIHCSTPKQVHIPANALAAGRTDLVLLEIDEGALPRRPTYEGGFPHVYGPIPTAAVTRVHDFPPNPDGTFTLPEGIGT
jgi:uncharacterized protein (DUF952 family)